MFIVNDEIISKENKFPCKSNKLKKFLVEVKGLQYISRVVNENTQRITWYFIKTDELDKALVEWKERKDNGELMFPKN